MTAENRRRKVEWAKAHSCWNVPRWSNVLPTDQFHFTVYHSDGGWCVWRSVGQQYIPQITFAFNWWGIGSLMVWAGISVTDCTDLHIVQCNMNPYYCRENVLQTIVLPVKNRVGDRFLLLDDNAHLNRVRIIKTFLEDINIQRMEWPAMSPDLYPMENSWVMLKTMVRNQNPATMNVATLTAALQ